jgi:hypothetical protein
MEKPFPMLNSKVESFFTSAVLAACFVVFTVSSTLYAQDKAPVKVELAGGKLLFNAPSNWEEAPKKSSILDYEFRAPKEAKEDAARITIMRSGGTIEDNINRWVTQFDGARKEDAKIEKKEVAGTKMHIVDIKGTFKDSMGMGGPFAPAPTKLRENYRMIGVIIETKDSGTVYIKMTGEQPIVEQLADPLKAALDDLKAQ